MRAPASLVCFETALAPSPQSAARPTTASSRMRSKSLGRWCLPSPTGCSYPGIGSAKASCLGLAVEDEDLEGTVRVEHDLAVVADDLSIRQFLHGAGGLLADHLLEAEAIAAHHVRLTGIE